MRDLGYCSTAACVRLRRGRPDNSELNSDFCWFGSISAILDAISSHEFRSSAPNPCPKKTGKIFRQGAQLGTFDNRSEDRFIPAKPIDELAVGGLQEVILWRGAGRPCGQACEDGSGPLLGPVVPKLWLGHAKVEANRANRSSPAGERPKPGPNYRGPFSDRGISRRSVSRDARGRLAAPEPHYRSMRARTKSSHSVGCKDLDQEGGYVSAAQPPLRSQGLD